MLLLVVLGGGGILLGLAIAPRLTAWDARHAGPATLDAEDAAAPGRLAPEGGRAGADGEAPQATAGEAAATPTDAGSGAAAAEAPPAAATPTDAGSGAAAAETPPAGATPAGSGTLPSAGPVEGSAAASRPGP